MEKVWTEAEVQKYINDGVPESLNLDYKAAGALAKADDVRREITKDVSAMANSDGGLLIYGVSEDKSVTPPVPLQIEPIDASVISREWLEQIIHTIRPRIDGIIIHPVKLASAANHIVYVVEIPQSTTAHQAQDKKYYKRFNFMSAPMEHYEIMDVMGRSQHPKVQLEFKLATYEQPDTSPEKAWESTLSTITRNRVDVSVVNVGNVYAQYVNTFVHIPARLVATANRDQRVGIKDGVKYVQFETNNIRESMTTYGPFLPRIARHWFSIQLAGYFNQVDCGECELWWTAHADNAPVNSGKLLFKDMELA